jgi:NAD(P)-dependent dehydrogenase (short-subunit alcohol dehydrogenase family)
VLAVNAGYYEFGRFGEITEEHFDKTFNTNVRGLLFTVQKTLPLLAEGASVILTGSIASIKGFQSISVYNASKAAVRSFARSWIADLKGRGIRINVLSPGHVETPGLSRLMSGEEKAAAVALVTLSMSPGDTFSPPDMIMSSTRPVTKRSPSASKYPVSPVKYQPSCSARTSASGRRQ